MRGTGIAKVFREFSLFLCILLSLSTCCVGAQQLNAAPEAAAEKAETIWLALIDHARWGESWDAAAPGFRAAISKEGWAAAARAARDPLGVVQSRVLRSASYRTSLPGAPDGHYVVLQYQTRFTNKQSAVETVTAAQMGDGSWKTAGYFVR